MSVYLIIYLAGIVPVLIAASRSYARTGEHPALVGLAACALAAMWPAAAVVMAGLAFFWLVGRYVGGAR